MLVPLLESYRPYLKVASLEIQVSVTVLRYRFQSPFHAFTDA